MQLKTYMLALLLLLGLTGGAKAKKQVKVSSYLPSKTVYMNTEGDGSITVRAYGHGSDRSDALKQAAKNALNDVIFEGIEVSGNPELSKPLVTAVNARERYQMFFNSFFADGGEYARFATPEDRKSGSNKKEENAVNVKLGTTVRIKRAELKLYLIDNGIIIP